MKHLKDTMLESLQPKVKKMKGFIQFIKESKKNGNNNSTNKEQETEDNSTKSDDIIKQ